MRSKAIVRSLGLVLCALAGTAAAAESWSPFAEADVVHIVTHDADGAVRDTKVWLVVVDGDAYVRTNDSRWLANIRRGSPVALTLEGVVRPVSAEEQGDAAIRERVEAAYLAKYGRRQRILSALRISEPTVLRLRPKAP